MTTAVNASGFDLSFALVIGINNYRDGIPPLRTARHDAEVVTQILEQDYQYQIHLLTDSEATLDNICQWLEHKLPTALETVESSRFLLYFAGHGIALNGDDGPAGYLVPQDAKLGDVTTYLSMSRIYKALVGLPCRHLLGILDCCFAGAFRWSSHRKAILADLGTIHRERFNRFVRDAAWQMITSAAHDQTASDGFQLQAHRGKKGTHSPFATALIDALSGSADAYPAAEPGKPAGDGVITATELYLYLRDHVELNTKDHALRQTPGIFLLGKHDKGEYIFLPPGHQLNLPSAPPLDVSSNPYRGLESFDEKYQHLFFGRTALTQELVEFVTTHSLTVVLGASGSGKSSLVKAGLLPQVRECEGWHLLPSFRPGESPFQSLNHVLESLKLLEKNENETTHSIAWSSTSHSQQKLDNLAKWFEEHPQAHLLVVIDQFEELITLCRNKEERQQFLNVLAKSIDSYPSQLHVVLTLRSDFESQFRSTTLEERWQVSRFIVSAMNREELREAIEEPASARVMYFSPHKLVDQLIDEVINMPGALSLLSFAMSELYLNYLKRQDDAIQQGETLDRSLTQSDYEEIGGVTRALTQRAEQEYKALVQENPNYDRTIRNVMLRMISVEGELARRRVSLSELEYPGPENIHVKTVIERFEKARLLTPGTTIDGQPYQEPAHDALTRGWERLLAWKQEYIKEILLQRELTSDGNQWNASNRSRRDVGLLWIEDPRLPTALQLSCGKAYRNTWIDLFRWRFNYKRWQSSSHDNWFNCSEADFVWQSFKQRFKRFGRTAIATTSVICVLLGTTLYALQRAAVAQLREQSTRSLNWISTANAVEGLLLAIDTVERSRSISSLEMTAQSSLLRAVQVVKESNRRRDHEDEVSAVAYSPDGKRIVSASADNTLRLWDAQTGHPIGSPLKGHNQEIWSVAYSSDGMRVVSGSADNTLRLWDALSGQPIGQVLQGHSGDIRAVAFSPDSKRIVSGSTDKTLRLWDAQTGQPIGQTFQGHSAEVWSVAFSPDGERIASGSADETIMLWDAQTGQPIGQPLQGHEDDVSSVAFSADGKYIVSGSGDNTVRLWDAQTGQPEGQPLRGHTVVVSAVGFSPDSKYIVSGSWDRTLRLWDVRTKQAIGQPLQGHGASVIAVVFSPDGKQIASGSADSTLRLWKAQTDQTLGHAWKGHDASVSAVAYSPDGKYVVSGSADSTLRLWDAQAGEPIGHLLQGHEGAVNAVAYSPDGKYVVSGSADSTLRLWNVQTSEPIGYPLQGHEGAVKAVAYSPDGKYVVSGSADNTLRLWNAQTGQPIGHPFQGHEGAVNAVAFSPDSKFIVSGSSDRKLRLWDVQTGEFVGNSPTVHGAPIWSVAFSPDGRRIVSGSDDRTLRLWDGKTGQPIGQSLDDGHPVRAVAFSPLGKRIVSARDNGTLRLWDTQTGEPVGGPIHGQGAAINAVAFSPEGKHIISGSEDNTVQRWDASPQSWLKTACNRLQYHPLINQPDSVVADPNLIKLAYRVGRVCQP